MFTDTLKASIFLEPKNFIGLKKSIKLRGERKIKIPESLAEAEKLYGKADAM